MEDEKTLSKLSKSLFIIFFGVTIPEKRRSICKDRYQTEIAFVLLVPVLNCA